MQSDNSSSKSASKGRTVAFCYWGVFSFIDLHPTLDLASRGVPASSVPPPPKSQGGGGKGRKGLLPLRGCRAFFDSITVLWRESLGVRQLLRCLCLMQLRRSHCHFVTSFNYGSA
jgi:hypothetical protein